METRWVRRLGPGIAAVAAVAAIASTTAGAPPPTWDPPDCPGPPSVGQRTSAAWFRLDPDLAAGTLVGQRLTIGNAEHGTEWRMDLDAESFAAQPRGGTVLVGTDDGRASRLSLIDVTDGCRWVVATSRDVVRGALPTPDGTAVVEHRVDRRTRADLGVWRRPFAGDAPTRLVPAIPADDRFGPTWVTELTWSADGDSLVVTSCGEVACRYRVVPAAGDVVRLIADPSLGSFVGMADDRLIVREACRGLPCALVSRAVAADDVVILDPATGTAVLSRDADGRSVVVHVREAELHAVRPDGTERRPLADPPDGLRLVAGVAWSGSAAEHEPDRLVFGPEGRVPLDGARPAILRSVDGTETLPLGEVPR